MSLTPSHRQLRPSDVEEIVSGVEGWLGPQEGRLLYDLAATTDPDGVIVEIGSWQGKSTIWLAAGARAGRGARVVAIDPHMGTHLRRPGESTEQLLRGNLRRAGLDDAVDVLVETSDAAAQTWSQPVSFLWIDGDHEYDGVLADLDLWEPHLMPDAAIALHDTFVWSGPERVVRERLIASRRYTDFAHAETTTAARRCGRLSARASLARRRALLGRWLYGTRLRAYDSNRLGYATLRDLVARGS